MPDGYDVLLDELSTHAAKVDALAERLQTAVDAARQVTMTNGAYGVICQPFAALLQPFEEMGVNALAQGTDALSDIAAAVRETSGTYDGQEAAEAARLGGIA